MEEVRFCTDVARSAGLVCALCSVLGFPAATVALQLGKQARQLKWEAELEAGSRQLPFQGAP